MFKLLLPIILAIGLIAPANANSSFGTKKVTKLIFHDSGNLYVSFSGETLHKEDCDSNTTYVIPKDNPFFTEIYAGLLAAMHTKSDVSGWVNGCVTVWGSKKVRVTRVDFSPQS